MNNEKILGIFDQEQIEAIIDNPELDPEGAGLFQDILESMLVKNIKKISIKRSGDMYDIQEYIEEEENPVIN